MQLTSTAFADGEEIPDRYGYEADDVNPPLEISGVPDDAESLALVMDDPDAMEPAGKVWDHWVVWNVDPDVGSIPEDWDASGAVEGKNDYGGTCYGGPNPPDKRHAYQFRVYALDETLDLDAGATKADLEKEMPNHILAEAGLTGTYAP
ncbi:YbhB/YbcL family Raf kinase inhibitor-like protein [Halobacteriales archaeon Cl-PHB]